MIRHQAGEPGLGICFRSAGSLLEHTANAFRTSGAMRDAPPQTKITAPCWISRHTSSPGHNDPRVTARHVDLEDGSVLAGEVHHAFNRVVGIQIAYIFSHLPKTRSKTAGGR